MLNPSSFDDTISPDTGRKLIEGGDVCGWNSGPLDLLGYRCSATIAGPSSRYQNAPIDIGRHQFTGDLSAQPFRLSYGCHYTR